MLTNLKNKLTTYLSNFKKKMMIRLANLKIRLGAVLLRVRVATARPKFIRAFSFCIKAGTTFLIAYNITLFLLLLLFGIKIPFALVLLLFGLSVFYVAAEVYPIYA